MYYCFALVYFRELTICIKMPAKQKNLKVDTTTTATIKNIPQNNTKNKKPKTKKKINKNRKKSFTFYHQKALK